MIVRLSGLVAAISFLAAPAFAGDASCFWNAAPQAARDAFLAKAATELPDTSDFYAFTVTVPRVDASGCHLNARTRDPATHALTGFLTETAAAHWLEVRKIVTHVRLDAGWTGMDPALRQAAVDAAHTPAPVPPETLKSFLENAGLSTDDLSGPGARYIVAYFSGRTLRAWAEAQY
jgi:hypothetical protein